MKNAENIKFNLPEDLKKCIEFHGHLCPGLVYGYLVAKEAITLLKLKRSKDEEVVAISENDSCAVDALQIMLGTSTGKGNLILKDYGKNAYTIFNRSHKKAFRFSRKRYYRYGGEFEEEFSRLDQAISSDTASEREKWRHKMLKAKDLLSKPFSDVFSSKEVDIVMPPYAALARSEACAKCGEMTMSTKMVRGENGKRICIPCSS
ncbi:MAG: formylmethanofuran dehydrogenase [Deltaproteobacteria bacterium]|nr:formylmethanofuran dehydrogenase [Deltaproteobacteria bacterium]MBW2641769.1 formylmethanofuran dehydrogenase [Deltaproteobacteria bacterium]